MIARARVAGVSGYQPPLADGVQGPASAWGAALQGWEPGPWASSTCWGLVGSLGPGTNKPPSIPPPPPPSLRVVRPSGRRQPAFLSLLSQSSPLLRLSSITIIPPNHIQTIQLVRLPLFVTFLSLHQPPLRPLAPFIPLWRFVSTTTQPTRPASAPAPLIQPVATRRLYHLTTRHCPGTTNESTPQPSRTCFLEKRTYLFAVLAGSAPRLAHVTHRSERPADDNEITSPSIAAVTPSV